MSKGENIQEVASSVSGESASAPVGSQNSATQSIAASNEEVIPGSEHAESIVGSNEDKSSLNALSEPPPSIPSDESKKSKSEPAVELYDTEVKSMASVENQAATTAEPEIIEVDSVPITEVPQEQLRPVIEIDDNLNHNIEYIAEFQTREEEVSKSHKKDPVFPVRLSANAFAQETRECLQVHERVL
ncbi:hypothetical protein HK103_002855 [Boothiomyces macroporosus]|uniref:Uncharacterized protein n=1 Tax=Boothiomyces macroporosus TaxID=261099 RepID=A0AAD5UM69_9FUNG|nr:hypothetical protein HK103_002855 [Boothiomyces macroporosus]